MHALPNLISDRRQVIRGMVYQPLPHHIDAIINIEVRLSITVILHILLHCRDRCPQHSPRQLMVVGVDRLERDAVNAHPVEVAARQDRIPMLLDRIHYEFVACIEDVDDGHGIGNGAGIYDDEGAAAANAPEHAGGVAARARR